MKQRNKGCEKERRMRNVEGNITVSTSFHSNEEHYSFFWFIEYTVKDVRVHQTFARLQKLDRHFARFLKCIFPTCEVVLRVNGKPWVFMECQG